MRLAHLRLLAIAAISVVMAACSGAPGAGGGTGGTITGTNWKLASYDVSGTSTPVPAGVAADARFAADKVAGSGGCNSFSGPAVVTGATIKVGPLASTQMACQPPANDVETAYLANLGKATSFTATAAALTMFGSDGKALLVYAAGPANPLIGNWVVTGFNDGKQAVTSPAQGTTLTATFAADQVNGSSGCNTYNGAYTLDGNAVKIGPLATTRMACPQDVMDQETAFLAALQAAITVETSGANVTLRDAGGAIQVSLAPG
jgi:heat shock protein HslJ